MVNIGNSWDRILADEFSSETYMALRQFLIGEYKTTTVYPPMGDIYNALKLTPYEKVKVVILGQDPYHEEGEAHGLAFSVRRGVPQPPSLKNIFKELKDELGIPIPPSHHGELTHWAEQGVLLLNTCLTVRAHRANSHRGKGWEWFTDRIIRKISDREEPAAFILWGRNARDKKGLIDSGKHLILEGAHPSPLSAYNGFFGGGYFRAANEFLEERGQEPIDWAIE